MKKSILLMTLVFLSFHLHSQILNASFEEWESFPSYDKPMDWDTNQDTFPSHVRFVKDTISYDGDYALHAVPSGVSGWTECSSTAQIGVKLTSPISSNKSLFFYIRALSVNAANITCAVVAGQLFLDGNSISNYIWETEEEHLDYTLIEIPLDNVSMIDSITINIAAAKGNEPSDGCYAASQVWFDKFYIAENSTTSIESIGMSNIKVFPNPAKGEVNLEGDFSSFSNYRMVNVLGQEVERGKLENSSIKINTVGVLFLVLGNEEGESQVFKINNQKSN